MRDFMKLVCTGYTLIMCAQASRYRDRPNAVLGDGQSRGEYLSCYLFAWVRIVRSFMLVRHIVIGSVEAPQRLGKMMVLSLRLLPRPVFRSIFHWLSFSVSRLLCFAVELSPSRLICLVLSGGCLNNMRVGCIRS